MSIVTKQEILSYLATIKPELEQMGIYKIGLFGSYAKDSADIASDIDITIETNAKEMIKKTGSAMNTIIYLDELRKRIIKHFKVQVDLCDTASMSEEKKNSIVAGAIYV